MQPPARPGLDTARDLLRAARARRLGAIAGGAAFILPGLVLILALSALFLAGSPPRWVRGAGAGAGAAVAAVAVQAGLSLLPGSRRRARRPSALARLPLVGGVAAATIGPWLVLVLVACGASSSRCARTPGTGPAALGGGVGVGPLVWVAFKVGALSYGGGFVIVPLMQADAVNHYHWLTSGQFLNAVALGQVTPGPVVQTVAAVGYAAAGSAAACSRRSSPSRRRSCSSWSARSGSAGCAAPRRDGVPPGAGPAAIGAILGVSVPLARALSGRGSTACSPARPSSCSRSAGASSRRSSSPAQPVSPSRSRARSSRTEPAEVCGWRSTRTRLALAHAADRRRNRRWWTLGAVSFSLFMIMLDNTIVNVALPSIGRGLKVGVSQLEWVVNAYTLSFAVLMLTGGRIADLYGRRLVFATGLALFTLSSLACGLAPSAAVLIAARSFQGAGGALMMPATLSIITAAFPAEERGTAIGIWAGVSGSALAIGPLARRPADRARRLELDLLRQRPGRCDRARRGVRLIVGVAAATRAAPLDLAGLLTSGAGLLALVYALIEANSYGWSSTTILGALRRCRRSPDRVRRSSSGTERRPMLDLGLFRQAHVRGCEHRGAARLAGDVRDLLLRLALHAEHPRLQPGAHRRDLPADDRARGRLGAARRQGDGPDRAALADQRPG